MLREKVGDQLLCAAAVLLSLKGMRQSRVGQWETAEIKSLTPSYVLVALIRFSGSDLLLTRYCTVLHN